MGLVTLKFEHVPTEHHCLFENKTQLYTCAYAIALYGTENMGYWDSKYVITARHD